ncbi:acyclic terpene utilization AtuA family protein [Streptomyces sp. NPDC088116]|uniref:acyclic terpene utilization AtuA family protein n=1 Tax=Streptomyces sp. NPDC088116 TaxID=3365825 RepID=UPI0037F7B431
MLRARTPLCPEGSAPVSDAVARPAPGFDPGPGSDPAPGFDPGPGSDPGSGSGPGSGDVLRIGNASGFYGDRFDALREMLTGGPLDVLTGDYLAELTMLILGRDRMRNPDAGYAKTFLRQLEEGLGLAHERGVRIVANAGGLNPAGLATAVRELAQRVGVPVRVAHVEGDDLLAPGGRLLRGSRGDGVLTANAYLGGAGIAACLRAGADVVVTGRVTDAALVTGPAAAHFGWDLAVQDGDAWADAARAGDARARDARAGAAFDALAGAVVAGHVLECGTQATGGNYAFFTEHTARLMRRPGFPLAEIHADGSAVITKHDGTGGVVDPGTVTAQLLYETQGARYAGPDVTARLDTVRLTRQGPDRVRISGVRGEPPPPTLKAGLNRIGGWRNEIVLVLTGLDIDAKARLVREQVEEALGKGARRPAEVRWELARTDRPDADTEESASALLRLVVRDSDEKAVGRAVSGAAVELALGSYPGFHVTAPPGKGTPYGVFEAVYVDAAEVPHTAVLPDGRRIAVPTPLRTRPLEDVSEARLPEPLPAGTPTRRAPLGLVAGARSGDKGGDANVGVWVRSEDAWRWLAHELTVDRFRRLIPESQELTVVRHILPNLRALNFTVKGLLGEGVAAQARFDPQAKALGEWLRARYMDIPEALITEGPTERGPIPEVPL